MSFFILLFEVNKTKKKHIAKVKNHIIRAYPEDSDEAAKERDRAWSESLNLLKDNTQWM